MLQIASSVAIISLIANIISNISLTNILISMNPLELIKDPPKSIGYLIAVSFLSRYVFYLSLTVTVAALIARFLL